MTRDEELKMMREWALWPLQVLPLRHATEEREGFPLLGFLRPGQGPVVHVGEMTEMAHAYTSTACQHDKHADCRKTCKFNTRRATVGNAPKMDHAPAPANDAARPSEVIRTATLVDPGVRAGTLRVLPFGRGVWTIVDEARGSAFEPAGEVVFMGQFQGLAISGAAFEDVLFALHWLANERDFCVEVSNPDSGLHALVAKVRGRFAEWLRKQATLRSATQR
jgi:hypothetical protein